MSRKSNLEKVYKVKCEKGYYLFKLNSLLDEKDISKNSVINAKVIDFNSIQRLIKGELTRVDLNIIAKLCMSSIVKSKIFSNMLMILRSRPPIRSIFKCVFVGHRKV